MTIENVSKNKIFYKISQDQPFNKSETLDFFVSLFIAFFCCGILTWFLLTYENSDPTETVAVFRKHRYTFSEALTDLAQSCKFF
jgi:hypothetical protein